MTNLTPTTQTKLVPWPTKYYSWYCVNFRHNLKAGYVYGSPEDAQKYQGLLSECHGPDYNYLTLDLVTEPDILAELEREERFDLSLLEDDIEYIQEYMDNRANNPHY